MKMVRFVCDRPITRHGRQLPAGSEFWIKKSSSRAHVDRWLAEKKIHEVTEPMKPETVSVVGRFTGLPKESGRCAARGSNNGREFPPKPSQE